MAAALPPSGPPVASIDEAIDRMQDIAGALPPDDGLACFNRMYLEVTQDVKDHIGQDFFADPDFVSALDVVFANIYFDAVDAVSLTPEAIPAAWQPLFDDRSKPGIYPIQFALAGMNAHINHDLPIAVVQTCTQLGTAPDEGTHHADYQKVDSLLDAAEQSVRESFESGTVLKDDRDARRVLDLAGNWSIDAARDVAWDTAAGLWRCHDDPTAEDLMMGALARTVAMASRCLLVPAEEDADVADRVVAAETGICDRVIRSIGVLLHG